MARLIDADTVVTIQVYDDMTEEYATKKMTIAEAIDEWSDEGCPPTVDAIPIEWIRNYVSIWISEPYKNFALNMINVWEKENGKSNPE